MMRTSVNATGPSNSQDKYWECSGLSGDWVGTLQAFEEGYRIAVERKLLSQQKTALENMHYSQMIRFDNDEEAKKLLLDIQNLEHLLKEKTVLRNPRDDYCSETETEGGGIHDDMLNTCQSLDVSKSATSRPFIFSADDSDDLVPVVNLIHQNKNLSKSKISQLDNHEEKIDTSCHSDLASSGGLQKSCSNLQSVGRKRARVVISDDEAYEPDDMDRMRRRIHGSLIKDMAISNKGARKDEQDANEAQDVLQTTASKEVNSSHAPARIEESTCSFNSKDPNASKSAASGSRLDSGDVSGNLLKGHDGAVCKQTEGNNSSIACKVGCDLIHVGLNSCMDGKNLDAEILKAEVACHYYLQLYDERRSKGLVPMIKHLKNCGKDLCSLEPIEVMDVLCGNIQIEAVISGWVPKHLMDIYIGCCEKLSEKPDIKLLKKLYNLEVSEDEVIVTDCGLQDISVSPILNALQAHKTVAVLDISHNFLGNETMEKLQQMFSASIQKYGGLTLDLHCNQFGPTSLFQICECPVLFARLEVLNLSQNRLTDSCSSYLCTILENCKALYSLSIGQCSITSRTIQKVADALHDGSVLSHLSIGNNNPVSGMSMVNLLSKLASLKRFSELNIGGIRLNKAMVDGICKLASSSTLSGLILRGTCIGMDGAVMLTSALGCGPQEFEKLDLSYCGLSSYGFSELCENISLIGGLLELNVGGNSIGPEACDPLKTVLLNQQCCLKTLILNNCHLGAVGIVQLIQATIR